MLSEFRKKKKKRLTLTCLYIFPNYSLSNMQICYTYNVYTIPMQAVFFFKRRRHIGAVLLDAFIDLFYFVDIWVCLRLAFMENGSLVKDPTAIRQRYTKV